jgi:hypothetical protein
MLPISHSARIIFARLLLACLAVISAIPLFLGLFFSLIMAFGGVLHAWNDSLPKGLTFFLVFSFAFCGVLSVINLCIHYLRAPFANPSETQAKKYISGLALGWTSLILIWLGAIGNVGEIWIGILPLMPCAAIVSLWWIANALCSSTSDTPSRQTT